MIQIQEIEAVEAGIVQFCNEADLLTDRFFEPYDSMIRDLYYRLSDRRQELGSRVSQLRVVSTNGYSGKLRDLDLLLQARMVTLQKRYLDHYLRPHAAMIFSSTWKMVAKNLRPFRLAD